MKDQPDTALRTPASRRISSPASQRLQSVTENRHPRAPPPIPVKSILRNSTSTLSLPSSIIVTPPQDHESDKQTSSSGTAATGGTAPPSYHWVPEQRAVDNESSLDSGPVEGEKLAELRRNGGYKRRNKRGGWWRMLLVIIVVCIVVVGLAVGLGVGLTVGRREHGSQDDAGANTSGAPGNETQGSGPQPFPLGQYTMLTALKNVSTDCTSNAETWTCYPRTIYDPSNPSSGGLATFDWILTNTSSIFATMGSGPTPNEGVPANISISSTDNPLSIAINNQSLTYISSASNSSTARLTFSYTMGKSVFPATSLTDNNVGTQCFFNQTVFIGTLYLSAPRNYPPEGTNSSSVQSSNIQWPYAVEVTQSSPGGEDSPACYEYMNGVNRDRITTGLTAQPQNSQCSCDYNNF
ncbi:hypothetical protein M409DRAFT_64458 [Zasmidium cellare ATCC 36951]|uniref:Tat pathway signal sequence n=1 Tax=Zasmidium cellare ATCC 36951 TaxID=1080233 RepID=A0A6A6CTQ2_ZASCE|nr:uncharacterized protein M409DRAFT_64458 [Zasmidium cellare ATCC 36951]KAF2170093.1 hypothetical protein M409DRAFT_64458 [Zasmidium cellare ATCC 36951]